MSGEYIIDPADATTENTWMAYKDQQLAIRSQVGVAYRSITVALRMYEQFAQRLADGGDLHAVAGYHLARSAGVLEAEQALIGHMQAALAIVEGMQAGVTEYELFPGVPRAEMPAATVRQVERQAKMRAKERTGFPILK